jgi:hypothetical protein
VEQRHDRRNTNWLRGRARAMSMLGNAKSESHRKTRQVEPDGPGRKLPHLTRGALPPEREGEVSRGRSSEEGGESRWSKGPKNQRNRRANRLREEGEEPAEITGSGPQDSYPSVHQAKDGESGPEAWCGGRVPNPGEERRRKC